MTINEAMTTAVKEGYHVKSFEGIDMYLSGANDEWSVWTRKDTESSFMARVEETFLDASFWQALGRGLEIDGRYPYGDWKHLWYAFVGHLSNGGTAESFFEPIGSASMDALSVCMTSVSTVQPVIPTSFDIASVECFMLH